MPVEVCPLFFWSLSNSLGENIWGSLTYCSSWFHPMMSGDCRIVVVEDMAELLCPRQPDYGVHGGVEAAVDVARKFFDCLSTMKYNSLSKLSYDNS